MLLLKTRSKLQRHHDGSRIMHHRTLYRIFYLCASCIILILSFSRESTPQTLDQSAIQSSVNLPPSNLLFTGFDQVLSTSGWDGIANLNWNSSGWSATLNENFHSVLIRQQQNLIRDEENFGTQIRHSFFNNLYGFGQFQSNYVSDNRQIGLNSVGVSTILGGLQFVTESDTLSGGAGNTWNKQSGIDNSGFTYNFYGATSLRPTEGAKLVPSLSLEDEQIFPRRNYDKSASIVYSQIFSSQNSLSFFGRYSTQLRDFYFPADSAVQRSFNVTNNIQDRTETATLFGGEVAMPIWIFKLNAQTEFNQRDVQLIYRYKATNDLANNFDTRIHFSNFNMSGGLSAHISKDTLQINMVHSERTETHQIINASSSNPFVAQANSNQTLLNNVGITNTLTTQLLLHFGSLSSTLTGLASLLRYNTPSELNYDDRDELTNTAALLVSNEFSPYFNAGFGLEADLIHIVYVDAQRSANNNRNFIYKLFPMVNYSDDDFTSVNRFEVLANYTVYDYEAYSMVHSFSFRQVSFFDSTAFRISSRISGFFLANVKIYTRGELYWANFSEFPMNYYVDQTLWFSVFYNSGPFKYGVGYKYLSLTQYNYVTAVQKEFAYQQSNSGPTSSISIKMSHLTLRANGWYQISRQIGTSTSQNVVIYPNFELIAQYNI
jgi:hypothetical protein